MGRVRLTRNSFNSGELDPLLWSRFDVRAHAQGAAKLRNVICLPQGGVRRRGGLRHLATIAEGDARLIPFSFSVTQDYLLVFVTEKMYVFKDGVLVTNINGSGNDYLAVPWTLAEILEAGWTQSADTLLVFHRDHPPYRITRGGTHATWTGADASFKFQPTEDFNADYDAITFTLGAVTGNGITLTASASVFTAQHVGGRFEGREGVADIVAYTSGTEVTIDILDDFDEVSQDGKRAFLTEPCWSAEHGYPGTGTFHEGRLWVASTHAQPQTVWGSRTSDFFNFDYGTGLPDEAIGATLDTDQVNQILHLVSNRHLQIMTTGGEFYMPGSPITPESSAVKRQTTFGASTVRPVTIDGSTLFVQRTGKVVREYLFDFVEDAYRSNSASLLASHLVKQPTDMAGYRGSQVEDANYVYLVNSDGTLSVYNSLREQEIAAWTRWDSSALFKRVAVLNEEVYFLMYFDAVTDWIIGGEGAVELGDYHLVRLDLDHYMDLFVHNAALNDDAITGLEHLEGETVTVRADGAALNPVEVSSATATFERVGVDVEAGLPFTVEIETLPVNVDLQDGAAFVKMKRLVSVYADLYESLGVTVDGFRLSDRSFGAGILDEAPNPYTEIRRVRVLGWDRQKTVAITQSDPQPMTLRSLTLEVET